ncbi:CsgG/HfaB family protein [Hyphomonas sp.]|uniref:CsgG/HfaB family protein n=1 Tax=Hyphomonas sp. TaxID=87 RepID=UPI0025BF38DF|nr:CsgG/HfaB family protein [Hyphomonas sp.]
MLASLRKFAFAVAVLPMMASACATIHDDHPGLIQQPAVSEVRTDTQSRLRSLPGPREKAAVAVYSFEDQTGQFKPSDGVQTLSRAVTQGSTSVLLKALQDAGDRSWFTVIERENLDNLLKERQIIREMRKQYLGEEELNEAALPPLLFAGIILEGGIIGYDTNTLTGGVGARFLGIGGKTDYREDKVTVYLRAVSVKTGEVITSVVASKKIASVGVAANAFRYVSFKELLEVDTGITTNEPDLLALRQATEKAVELLIMEGAALGVWQFQDQVAGAALLENYLAERDGIVDELDLDFAEQPASPPVKKAAALTGKSRTPPPALQETKPEVDLIAEAAVEEFVSLETAAGNRAPGHLKLAEAAPAAHASAPAGQERDAPWTAILPARVNETALPLVPAGYSVSQELNPVAQGGLQPFSWTGYKMKRVVGPAFAGY